MPTCKKEKTGLRAGWQFFVFVFDFLFFWVSPLNLITRKIFGKLKGCDFRTNMKEMTDISLMSSATFGKDSGALIKRADQKTTSLPCHWED